MESNTVAQPQRVLVVRRVLTGSAQSEGTRGSRLTSDTYNRLVAVPNPNVRVKIMPPIKSQRLPISFQVETNRPGVKPTLLGKRTSPRDGAEYGVPRSRPTFRQSDKQTDNIHDVQPPSRPASPSNQDLVYDVLRTRPSTKDSQPRKDSIDDVPTPSKSARFSKPEEIDMTASSQHVVKESNKQLSAPSEVLPPPGSIHPVNKPRPDQGPDRPATQGEVYSVPSKKPWIKDSDQKIITEVAPPQRHVPRRVYDQITYDVPPSPRLAKPYQQEGVYDVPKNQRIGPRPSSLQPLPSSRQLDHHSSDQAASRLKKIFQLPEHNVPALPPGVRISSTGDTTSLDTSPYLRSPADLLDSIIGSQNITELNQKTFQNFLSTRDAAVVMFYHPSEGKLQHYKDQYVQASSTPFHHSHAFAFVDCSREKELCRNEHIASYPVFKVYNNGITTSTIQGSAVVSANKIQEYLDNHTRQRRGLG